MDSKLIRVWVLIASCAVMAWAAPSASIRGQVQDSSGGAVAGAVVSVTDPTSGAVVKATTGADGSFQVSGLETKRYEVTVEKAGFTVFREQVSLRVQPEAVIQARLAVRTNVQSVEVHEKALPGVTPQPTQQEVLESNQSIRVLDRRQMDAAGPVAGAAQILSYTPGANVIGYGNTGATKYTITLNGINQGWGGYGGYTSDGSLGVTFDGIPIVDPATGLWQSPTIPQTEMLQDTTVTYGPGDPLGRWYTNVGGGIEFTPVQPASKPHLDATVSYGSYAQKNVTLNLFTGLFHGWSTVVSGGMGDGNSYRVGPDGFSNPSKDGAVLFKTAKTFQAGSFDLGGYYAKSGGYRDQVIPTTANTAITLNGQPGNLVYSQPTSGFYSTLPYDSYNKYDTNEMWLIYGRETLNLDSTTTLQNQTWYMHIGRLHNRLNDVYSLGPQQDEWNNPHTNDVGDSLWLAKQLPLNNITVGTYYISTLYNSRNNFYNPADGGNRDVVNIGGKIRSSYFTQDDFAVFVQDIFHPIPILSITPGIRYAEFQTGYSASPLTDFSFAPGVILSSHCPLTLTSTPGNTKDQGASCDSHQIRSGVEPSLDVTLRPVKWLSLYSGYQQELHSPPMGGGGGLFQSVDPNTYHLSRGGYFQAGVKAHLEHAGALNDLLFGAAYYQMVFSEQEIDIPLANGNVIAANGASTYHGVNAYVDDDPVYNLHVFANLNGEGSRYTNYVVGSTSYNGAPVSYVPSTTLNLGAYYDIQHHDRAVLEPRVWYQFVGSQHIFDNNLGAPSTKTMPSYGTMNLMFKAPIKKYLDLDLTMLNLLNKQYNEFEYISSGGYFGTPTGGYALAYPASPFTVYGTLEVHF